jgi:peptidoglycan/LPS O-acetylase OafA/YrhL
VQIQFYLLYLLLMMGRPRITLILAAAISVGFLIYDTNRWGEWWCFLPYWHQFLLGAIAFRAWQHPKWRSMFIAFASMCVTVGIVYDDSRPITAAITATVLLAVGLADRMDALAWTKLHYIGTICFSVYLTRLIPIFFVTKYIRPQLTTPLQQLLGLLLIYVLVLALAVALYWLMERPSIALSKRLRLVDYGHRAVGTAKV